MTEYIKRSADKAKEFDLEKTLDVDEFNDNTILLDFLKKNYSYIHQAIEYEGYIIEEYSCPFFREVVYDDKVVGFYTFEYISDFIQRLCINEFFVVPEYRKNKIFINTLKKLIAHSNYDSILLRNPPRLIIDILIKNGMAKQFSKNLVRTGLKLATRINKIMRNKKLNKLYMYTTSNEDQITYMGNVYDMNLNSIVFNDRLDIITDYDDIIILSNPRMCDNKKYHLAKKIKNVDKRYVKNIYKTIVKSWDELEKIQEDIDKQFMENNGIDMYLGTLDEPIDLIQDLIDDDELNGDELESIRMKIEKALESHEISTDNILTRFYYLLDNKEKEPLVTGTAKTGHCPYCDKSEFEDGVCLECGYNLFDKKLEEIKKELTDKVDPGTGVYKSLLKTIDEKSLDKDEVIRDQIEISACQLLNFVNQLADYPSLPDFDDNNEVSEELYVKYLTDNGLIELKENTRKDDEKYFVDMLRQMCAVPSARAYKSHMHREYRYKITKKGRRYYTQNKIANLYIEYVINLPYYQFKKFYNKNINSLNENEILCQYVVNVKKEIIEMEDLVGYNNVCFTMLNILKDRDDKWMFFIYMIKSLICRLNYYLISIDNPNFTETPIDAYNEVFLKEYKWMTRGYDYDEAFDEAYESIEIESLKVNREDLYNQIEEILKADDISTINKQLAIKYNDIQ
ncbi:MAG: hypothetical protein IJI98_05420 [Methanosphaera sp.]|nr:hypothetical protein [Methanosphaera sp.]